MYEWSSFSTSSPVYGIFSIYYFSYLKGVQWCFIMVLVLMSLMTNDIEHLVMCLFATYISPFAEMSLRIFCPFSNYVCFLISRYELFISLDTSPLSNIQYANIFCQSIMCIFILNRVFHRIKIFHFHEVQFIKLYFFNGPCFWF